ncbi:MAG: MtnX-like HAD-IB family phosphatase [Candidatus Omnitrophota bacterium]|jgi:2,3-diketo-5-methylthio-1-phosphopentane phosphatase
MAKENKDNIMVFFDFDNTITTTDIIDDMLARFSKDDEWKALEERWQREEIGSRECLKGQIEGIRIDKDKLDEYLSTISIDPYFKRLLKLFKSRGIPALIVSDNFDYMVRSVLKSNDITDIEVYCNRTDLSGDKLNPSFPYANKKCGDCANCKKTHLLAKKRDGVSTVYIGDGRSDVCASRVSDVVFAKDYLKELFKKEGRPHIAIDSLKDVYEHYVRRL